MHLEMEPSEDEESWLEEQWERWLTHDISLEEFEDEDFSEITEITDECGLSLHCKESLSCRAHVMTEPHGPRPPTGGAAGRIQAEMLELDLIDAGDDIPEEAPELRTEPLIMDQYRPKRPTTLNLFPQVPRTQDTLNNNSLGKKNSWQERVSRSSSPLKTGEQSSPHEHICLSDEGNLRNSAASTKDRGTSTESPCRRSTATQSAAAAANVGSRVPEKHPGTSRPTHQPYHQHHSQQQVHHHPGTSCSARGSEAHRDRIRYQADVRLEATEEIFLTPVQKNSDPQEPDRRFPSQSSENRMSTSSDVDTLNYQSMSGKPNSSISEEDEVLDFLSSPEKCNMAKASCNGGHGYRSSYGTQRASVSSDTSALSYDSVKYTLVVDENVQLELVSLKQCYTGYSDESDSGTVYDNCVSSPYESAIGEEYEEDMLKRDSVCPSDDSSPEDDIPFSKKFLNVFMSGRSRSSSAESFGLFSCIINGEEREQTHRAVFRFVPRHDDELELEVDDPLLVEVQAEDFWYEAFNMRTGDRGIFPAYYAIEVAKEQDHMTASVKNSDWVERFCVKFLGSVQVPYHKGNDVMCAAMQKVANSRRLTVHFNPPSSCILEISMRGVKIVVTSDDSRDQSKQLNKCSHFFQLKNISFCGYHPKNNKYFGFITKHPADHRFACHVFVSEESTKPLAESVGHAFQLFYKEFVEYTCPTEDIYLE